MDPSSSSSSSHAVASSSSSSTHAKEKSVPGSKGRPASQGPRTKDDDRLQNLVTGTNGAEQTTSKRHPPVVHSTIDDRSSSAARRTMRRSSLLKDGTSAIPHPQVPDDKLHRHCSGELIAGERMKHLTVWTLERSRKEMKGQATSDLNAKYHTSLFNALKFTLQDVNKGSLRIDWDSKGKGRAKDVDGNSKAVNGTRAKLPPHPLNESNKKQESILKVSVKELQRQDKARKQVEDDLSKFERETEQLRMQMEEEKGENHDQRGDELEAIAADVWQDEWTAEDRVRLKKAAGAISSSRSDASDLAHDSTLVAAAMQFLKKCGSTRDDIDHAGRVTDPRWNDVEYSVDLLRSKSHNLAQLSSLSQRYIAAVSARGAMALKEMTSSSKTSSSRQPATSSSSPYSSTIGLESRNNLERILSSLRSIEAERSADEEEEVNIHLHAARQMMGQGAGDISEGDLLRAYAELS